MEYKCKMIGVTQLNVSPHGFVMPLCESCKCQDCSNPIEKTRMSILGVTKEIRVFSGNTNPRFVIDCEGFINV